MSCLDPSCGGLVRADGGCDLHGHGALELLAVVAGDGPVDVVRKLELEVRGCIECRRKRHVEQLVMGAHGLVCVGGCR